MYTFRWNTGKQHPNPMGQGKMVLFSIQNQMCTGRKKEKEKKCGHNLDCLKQYVVLTMLLG